MFWEKFLKILTNFKNFIKNLKIYKKILKVLKIFNKMKIIYENLYFLLLSRLTAECWLKLGQFINFLIFRVLGERSPCSPWLHPCSALSYFYLGEGLRPPSHDDAPPLRASYLSICKAVYNYILLSICFPSPYKSLFSVYSF